MPFPTLPSAFLTQKVHSFDLVASAPGVVACNMADVPLESGRWALLWILGLDLDLDRNGKSYQMLGCGGYIKR